MIVSGPHPDIALTRGPGQARGKQIPGEDPLYRILGSDMERHPYGVRVSDAVAKASHERNGPMLRNHKTETELS